MSSVVPLSFFSPFCCFDATDVFIFPLFSPLSFLLSTPSCTLFERVNAHSHSQAHITNMWCVHRNIPTTPPNESLPSLHPLLFRLFPPSGRLFLPLCWVFLPSNPPSLPPLVSLLLVWRTLRCHYSSQPQSLSPFPSLRPSLLHPPSCLLLLPRSLLPRCLWSRWPLCWLARQTAVGFLTRVRAEESPLSATWTRIEHQALVTLNTDNEGLTLSGSAVCDLTHSWQWKMTRSRKHLDASLCLCCVHVQYIIFCVSCVYVVVWVCIYVSILHALLY